MAERMDLPPQNTATKIFGNATYGVETSYNLDSLEEKR